MNESTERALKDVVVRPVTVLAAMAAVLAPCLVSAADAVSAGQDRLLLSASGSTLAGASGGGMGSVDWLHDFTPNALIGIGAEYDTLDDAHWSVGSISGALSTGSSTRWTFVANVRHGSGDIGTQPFDYAVEALSAAATLGGKLSLQIQTRQFDVYTTNGNLPQASASWIVTPHWQLGAGYAHSVSGTLHTRYATGRVDHYGGRVNWFLGGALGYASPAVLDVQTGLTEPSPGYREGYAGLGRTLWSADWQLIGDYLVVAGVQQLTLTMTCTLRL